MASSTLLLTRIAIWATQLLIFLCITTTSSVVEPSSEISIHYLTDRRTEVAIRDLEQDKRNEILTKNLRFEADNYPTILHTNAELLKRDAMSKLFSQVNLQHVTAISSEMQRTTTSDPVSTLASVAVQFINLNVYGSWNCQDDPLTVITYGTASNNALSAQYLWNASTKVVSLGFYLDAACTTRTALNFVESLSLLNAGVCKQNVKYTVTSVFTTPSIDGYVSSQYVSSAACSQGISAADDYLSTAVDTPIYAVWISLVDSFTDDAISQAPNDNCRNTQTISSRSGANQVNYTATVYVGDVVVQTAVATNKPYGACFPGTETLLLSSGESIPISAVQIGDLVLSADRHGRTSFSEVIAVPHKSSQEMSLSAEYQAHSQRSKTDDKYAFIHIFTESGKDVRMTYGHIIPVLLDCKLSLDRGNTITRYIEASEVRAGMCVRVANEQRTESLSTFDLVVSVDSNAVGHGLYTVITNEELIVVNGVVASPFAGSHEAGDTFFTFYRWLRSGHDWLSADKAQTTDPLGQLLLILVKAMFKCTACLLRSGFGIATLDALGEIYSWWAPFVVWSYSVILSL